MFVQPCDGPVWRMPGVTLCARCEAWAHASRSRARLATARLYCRAFHRCVCTKRGVVGLAQTCLEHGGCSGGT